MPALHHPPALLTEEESRRIFPEVWLESDRQNRVRDEENERRAALATELRRIGQLEDLVERVNGWERLEELVDAQLGVP